MSTPPVARAILRVPYLLLRAPLSVLDERVAGRYLAEDSTVRTGVHRGLGLLDAAAARLLGAGEKTGDVAPEARASEQAPVSQEASEEAQDSVPAEPDEEQVERVAEQLLTDPDLAPVTGELADADEEDQRYIAELRAKNIVAEHEAVHGRD